MRHDSKALRAAFMMAALLMGSTATIAEDHQFTPQDIRQDIEQAVDLMLSLHPDPSHSFDADAFRAEARALMQQADHPMSEREAWKLMASLNPGLKDAHASFYYPKLRERIEQHLAAGGRVLPVTVALTEDNKVRLTSVRTTAVNTRQAPIISEINGVKSEDIVAAMMKRAQGDSESFRRAYVANRFSDLHWELYGGSPSYDIRLDTANSPDQVIVPGGTTPMRPKTIPLERQVERRILDDHIGYLRVDAFAYPPEQEKAFFDFIVETWQTFHEAGVRDVIIDVRKNGGGTDHYWQMGIAPYVAEKSFPFLSYFKMRMTERNLKLGPIQGPLHSMQEGPAPLMVPIKAEEPLRIPGTAYLLAGPYSYSSTILFLTAMQDSGNAVIAGQPTGGRSCSSGRIEHFTLDHTGIEITVPTLIFTRPSGPEKCMAPVEPDILIDEDPADPNAAVRALAKEISGTRE